MGITLLRCEGLQRFDAVFSRAKKGDKSALSELTVAANLAEVGFPPILEPPLNNNVLDAVVNVGSEKVYIEVINPELSAVMQDAYSGMKNLAERLLDDNFDLPVVTIDVFLLVDPSPANCATISHLLRHLPRTGFQVIFEIPEVAVVRFDTSGQTPSAFEPMPNPLDLPVLVSNSFTLGPSRNARANVRYYLRDERAERLLKGEAHHFSKDEMNILVMDLSHIPIGIRKWSPLIERRFQPRLNRRFGAVALFDNPHAVVGSQRRWKVLCNEHAYHPIPIRLLHSLEALDGSYA